MSSVESNTDDREWVRDIWNNWFEEVYPTSPDPSEWAEEADDQDEQQSSIDVPDKLPKRYDKNYQ
jgi:hypothetical protein